MHEMGIAMQIAQIAVDSVPKEIENPKIDKINLKIGKLSGIIANSLTFCFDIIIKDNPVLNLAKLNIEEINITLYCNTCHKTWSISEPVFKCKFCESGSIKVISGQELDISSIELFD